MQPFTILPFMLAVHIIVVCHVGLLTTEGNKHITEWATMYF